MSQDVMTFPAVWAEALDAWLQQLAQEIVHEHTSQTLTPAHVQAFNSCCWQKVKHGILDLPKPITVAQHQGPRCLVCQLQQCCCVSHAKTAFCVVTASTPVTFPSAHSPAKAHIYCTATRSMTLCVLVAAVLLCYPC